VLLLTIVHKRVNDMGVVYGGFKDKNGAARQNPLPLGLVMFQDTLL